MKTASEAIEELTGAKLPAIPDVELPRPFEYQTDKYKTDGKTGEEVGATAIDLLLIRLENEIIKFIYKYERRKFQNGRN